MSQHTPGPWAVLPEEVDKPYIRIRGTAIGCRYKIANVITPVYDGVHEREAIETRANARLIAAAPMMLEELNSLVAKAEAAGWHKSETESARDAIRKAVQTAPDSAPALTPPAP